MKNEIRRGLRRGEIMGRSPYRGRPVEDKKNKGGAKNPDHRGRGRGEGAPDPNQCKDRAGS